MSMIGATVTVRQLPGIVWVVRGVDSDGRLRLRSRDHNRYTSRACGAGDVSVITPAPSFTPGTQFEHDGQILTVVRDEGDQVVFAVGDACIYWPDNTSLRIPGGNTYTLSKADVVLEVAP